MYIISIVWRFFFLAICHNMNKKSIMYHTIDYLFLIEKKRLKDLKNIL